MKWRAMWSGLHAIAMCPRRRGSGGTGLDASGIPGRALRGWSLLRQTGVSHLLMRGCGNYHGGSGLRADPTSEWNSWLFCRDGSIQAGATERCWLVDDWQKILPQAGQCCVPGRKGASRSRATDASSEQSILKNPAGG